jgi:tetratricopeptide (TPR) repeat protein
MALSELRVFIAKSFGESDKAKVAPIENFLASYSSLGVKCETGEAAEAESVSAKVRERIDRAHVLVGIVTQRHAIVSKSGFTAIKDLLLKRASRWSAPPWVLQEVGYALKGQKTIILFIESGIDFGGLQSDLEYIPYDFRNTTPAIMTATQMLTDAIAAHAGIKVQTLVRQEQPSRGPEEPPLGPTEPVAATPPEETDPLWVHFENLRQSFEDRDFSRANQAFQDGLVVIQSRKHEFVSEEAWNILYFRKLAQAGEPSGIENLEAWILKNPDSAEAHSAFGAALKEYGYHERASSEFLSAARSTKGPPSCFYRVRAADCLLKGSEPRKALDILYELFPDWRFLSIELKTAVLDQLFEVHKALGDEVLSQATAELALNENPANHELRFKLALEYSRGGCYELSLLHNRVIIDHDDSHSAAIHNLGVALSNCGLPISAISRYRRSLELGETLSANNIARKYVDSGFALDAEKIFNDALKQPNCASAVPETLGAVQIQRSDEEQKEQEKLKDADRQKRQLVRLGEGLLYQGVISIDGLWEMKSVSVSLKSYRGAGTIDGTGERIIDPLAANAVLSLSQIAGLQRNRRMTISGSVRGRVWTYKMTVVEGYPNPPSFDETIQSSGFIVFEENFTRAEMIED